MGGESATPRTRLFCRQKRISSRCQSVAAGRKKLLNDGSCFADEDIFERRLVQSDGVDGAGEGLDDFGDEAVAVFDFDAHPAVHHGGLELEAAADVLRELRGVGGLE